MEKQTIQALQIRAARPDDIIQRLRIQVDALRTLCAQDYSTEQIEALIERNIHFNSQGGDDITIVAETAQVLVGCAALLGNRISALYVHPHFARQGIGSQLLQSFD